MTFNLLNNPIHSWISKTVSSKEKTLNQINLVDPIDNSKEITSQLIGPRFYQELHEKVQVMASHHKDLNKQTLITPYTLILKNQKEVMNPTVPLSDSIEYSDSDMVQLYPSSSPISVYKSVSSTLSGDKNRIHSQFITYQFDKQNKLHHQNYLMASHILESAFLSMGFLINKPKYTVTPSKTNIQVFYYQQTKRNSRLIQSKCRYLILYLSRILGTTIQLNMIKLSYIFADSTILAKALVRHSYKGRFLKIVSTLFKQITFEDVSHIQTFTASQYDLVPSFVSGIKVRLGGRTIRQRIVPRKTVQTLQKGTLARTKAQYVEKAQISHKTRRGAFTFTVHIGHAY